MQLKLLALPLATLAQLAAALPSSVELERRADEIDCTYDKLTSSHGRKSTFKEHVDNIPDERHDLNKDPEIGFQISDSPPPGICIAVSQRGGDYASGSYLIKMAKDGYKKCVEEGSNSRDGDTFYNFSVGNDGYYMVVGGGGCPGTFGVPGKPIYI